MDDALLHAMSGTELSRVRTELRLLPPEAYRRAIMGLQISTQESDDVTLLDLSDIF